MLAPFLEHPNKTWNVEVKNFNALTYDMQMNVLNSKGSQVAKRLEKDHTVTLYKVENYFAEVFFHREKLEMPQIRGLLPSDLPRAYLDSFAKPLKNYKTVIMLYQ